MYKVQPSRKMNNYFGSVKCWVYKADIGLSRIVTLFAIICKCWGGKYQSMVLKVAVPVPWRPLSEPLIIS